jgi:hypothetical protein
VQARVYVSVPTPVGVSVAVPLVDWLPLQAPLAVHAVAFVDDQVSVALAPSVIVVGFTEIVTVGATAFTVRTAVLAALPPGPVQVSMYESVPVAVGVMDLVPLVPCDPLHAPLAVHAVAFVEDQVSVALAPSVIVPGDTEISAVGAAGAFTVSVADWFALPPAPVQVSV